MVLVLHVGGNDICYVRMDEWLTFNEDRPGTFCGFCSRVNTGLVGDHSPGSVAKVCGKGTEWFTPVWPVL